MSRFVVQVVDDHETEANSTPTPDQAAPATQSLPSSHRARRGFVVEEIMATQTTVVRSEVAKTEVTKTEVAKTEVIKTEAAKIEATKTEVRPFKQNATVQRSPDYISQKEAQIKQLLQAEDLQRSKESPQVSRPKRGPEANFVNQLNQSSVGQSKAQNMQKIERFYQRSKGEIPPTNQPGFLSKLLFRWKNNQGGWRTWLNLLARKIKKHRFAVVILALLVMVSGSGWLGYLKISAQVKDTYHQAQSLVEDVKQGRRVSASERLAVLQTKYLQYYQIYSWSRPVVLLFQGQEKTQHLDRLFEISGQGLETVTTGLQLYGDLETGYQQFVGEQEGKSVETLGHLSGGFEALFTQLSQLYGQLQHLGNPYNLVLIDSLQTDLSQQLPEVRKTMLAAQKMSVILPELLGAQQEKTYLLLFQNNAELRPTGGFIGSVGLVRLSQGKLIEFKIEDVYEIDGQLNGFVTPPEEIVQYLGEEQWFLRDVNWSPDFPTVANRAGWFLDKSRGITPDGVIAVNLEVVQSLLKVVGPIELVDYNEVVTSENLYDLAQSHSELNFFPGSTGKKDFLSAVANQLLNKMFYQDSNKVLLAEALLKSAEESQLLISVNNPVAQEVLASLGWNGELRTPSCPSPFNPDNCFVDTVMQVEANVGVNKANQKITRQITDQVELQSGSVRHTRQIILNNLAQSEAWPAGKYKTYLRLFVPLGSTLGGIKIDGQALSNDQIKQVAEDDKQVFGVYLEVPIKSSKTIEIFYEVPWSDSNQTYALFEQKQSGTSSKSDELVQIIDVGQRDVTTVAPEPSLIDGRQLRFVSGHDTHMMVGVEW